MRIIPFALLGLLLLPASPVAQPAALDQLLPARVEPVYRALDAVFEEQVAMDTVLYMDQFWRIAGNPGFNKSQDYILERLREAGVSTRLVEFPNDGQGWELVKVSLNAVKFHEAPIERDGRRMLYENSSLRLDGRALRNAVAINSFPTPPPDVAGMGKRYRLVDVGAGTNESDYTGKSLAGAVVLTSSPLRAVWPHAVVKLGAAGIISSYVPSYNRPSEQPDVVSWESIPYDAKRRAFGLKVSQSGGEMLRQQAADGYDVVLDIATTFHGLPNRNLIAEIPGTTRADERIVMVAHIQEPGANDDASGCGTLLALARALQRGIAAGTIPPPARTLTFLWVDEIRGSDQWLNEDAERAKKVQYMFSLDMTGEDTSKTGGTFLIEKQPDPSAVWDRPSDPHSEWGASAVDRASLRGSLLTDVHLAVCLRRARDMGWVVRTNPYEGGSDHTVFGKRGIPSLLNWHFTDRYYHTNLDRPENVSPAEMKNVGISVATSAWLLASANADDARAVTRLIEQAAASRMALERKNAEELARLGKSDSETERLVLAAWKQWYAEALDSVKTLSTQR